MTLRERTAQSSSIRAAISDNSVHPATSEVPILDNMKRMTYIEFTPYSFWTTRTLNLTRSLIELLKAVSQFNFSDLHLKERSRYSDATRPLGELLIYSMMLWALAKVC